MRRPGLARPLSCFSVLLASNNEPARLLGGLGFRPGSHPPPLFSPHSYIRAGGSPPSPGGNCHRRGRRTMSGCTWRPNLLLKISWGTGSTRRGSGTLSGKAKGGPGRTADGDQGASSEGSDHCRVRRVQGAENHRSVPEAQSTKRTGWPRRPKTTPWRLHQGASLRTLPRAGGPSARPGTPSCASPRFLAGPTGRCRRQPNSREPPTCATVPTPSVASMPMACGVFVSPASPAPGTLETVEGC